MKTFKIILICIFSATLAFVAFRSSLRGTKAIYETTQPQYREIKEEINISGNVFPMKEIDHSGTKTMLAIDKLSSYYRIAPPVRIDRCQSFISSETYMLAHMIRILFDE